MYKFLPAAEFKREAQAGRVTGAGVMLPSFAVRGVNAETRTASFIFSTGEVDRSGDRIDPAGWELTDFRRNPVAQYGHDGRSLPIGRAKNVRVENARLIGDIEFVPADISRFGDQCFRMVQAGYLRAVSVGFMPLSWSWANDKTRPVLGIDFRRQALIEISVVNVPAHQSALLIGNSAPSTPTAADKARARRQRQLQLLRLANGP